MEEKELIQLWKAQDAKIERSLEINKRLLKELTQHKVQKALKPLIWLKIFGIISFIVYLLFLGFALFVAIRHYSSACNYFIISVAAILLVNIKGLADYVRHLIWVYTINYDSSVIEIQSQLTKLQLSILNLSKTMVLQIPFYTTMYLSDLWFPSKFAWWGILLQLFFTGSFVYITIRLYKDHKIENLDKKWLKSLLADYGKKYIDKAMKFYREIEEFEQETG